MPRRRQSNVDGTLRSKASSDFPKPSSANPNPIKPGRRSDIVKMKHQKEEIKAIKQQKEEIKAIEHQKKAEQLLTSVSTDTPNDIEEELPEPLRLESSLPKFPFPWRTDFSDPDLPWPPLPRRPLHPNHHGRYNLPSDFIDVCEICGANHWTDTCSYFREIQLGDAKLIDESKFDIICFNCCKAIAYGACPVRCSPARFKIRRKPFPRHDLARTNYAPTNHLSKDLYTAYGFKCLPPQQVPTSFSGKQKEASVSTKTPNTIKDLPAPLGSNSSSQERKTYPLAFYDIEARWRAARERIMPNYSP